MIPTKAQIKVTFKNGVVKTVENTTLSGDPTLFTKGTSIQQLINDASAGATLKLASGNYDVDAGIDIIGKNITLIGNGNVVLTADVTPVVRSVSTYHEDRLYGLMMQTSRLETLPSEQITSWELCRLTVLQPETPL